MNVKNFLVAGFVGGIVNYLLGWLFWGILFKDSFPTDESQMNMLFIFLGCMTAGFFISYVFIKWASIATATSGAIAGAVFSLFLSLHSNFFQHSMSLTPDYRMMATDIILSVICGIFVGGVVGFVNGKMK
jgi:hypothetical protein